MTEVSPAGALLPGAVCAKHAERAATGVCGRCGDYVCGACGRATGERLYCEGCAQRFTHGHSKRAVHALVLGLLGVHGLFVLAPVALTLASLELSAIRSGEAPLGGTGLARAGLALGACGIAIPISVLLVWLGTR
jgi:hypothetical protein